MPYIELYKHAGPNVSFSSICIGLIDGCEERADLPVPRVAHILLNLFKLGWDSDQGPWIEKTEVDIGFVLHIEEAQVARGCATWARRLEHGKLPPRLGRALQAKIMI